MFTERTLNAKQIGVFLTTQSADYSILKIHFTTFLTEVKCLFANKASIKGGKQCNKELILG